MSCLIKGCSVKNACFGVAGGKGIYCSTHKKIGMINIRRRLCARKDCGEIARYATLGKSPMYCGVHRNKKNMIKTAGKKTFKHVN